MRTALLLGAAIARADDTGVGVPANPGPIQLVDDLDPRAEGDAFCADLVGGSADAGDWIQAHNCHLRGGLTPADQEFTTDYPSVGNIYATQGDLCLQARRVAAGSDVFLAACSTTNARQQWVASSDGQIHPANDTTLCWTVESVPPVAGGGRNTKRDLTLETCDDVSVRFVTWFVPGGSVGI